LFKIQDAPELRGEEDSKTWVKYLYKMVNRLNIRKLDRIGMTPKKAVKLKSVELNLKSAAQHDLIASEYGLYRYLLQPGEEHGDQTRRATDRTWSKETYRLDRIVENLKQRVLYYLASGPESAFVRKKTHAGT